MSLNSIKSYIVGKLGVPGNQNSRDAVASVLGSQHAGYKTLYEKYGKDIRYKKFFSKLRIEGSEVIFDKKKFSVLKADHNGEAIISGDHEDSKHNKGLADTVYMKPSSAMEEAKRQGKKLFKTKKEVENFINQFPGESTQEKIQAFVDLFGLEMSGFWDPISAEWKMVDNMGYVLLSEVDPKKASFQSVMWHRAERGDFGGNIEESRRQIAEQVLAFENS